LRAIHSVTLALGLVAAAAAYAWYDVDAGVETWRRLRREVGDAQERVRALETENERLRAEAEALRTDPFVQERAVREELRWVRPGETLVRVSPREGPGGTGSPP
jgi:cell division protein FtsB